MAANGISTLSTKQARQIAKLEYAQAKRKGRVITDGGALGTYGTWSDNGTDDNTANYYRSNNTYDATSLPDTYNGNVPGADDNPNTGGLILKRPWISISAQSDPGSIDNSVDGSTLAGLQIWYDGADTTTLIPSATDEGQITQWTDKSSFAHNANPNGGSAKPTYENTTLQNGYGYIEFDGNDNLNVNPFTTLQSAAGFTVFVVSKLANTTGVQYFTETDQNDLRISADGTGITVGMAGATGTVASEANTNWAIHTLVFDGSQTGNAARLIYRKDKAAKTLTFTGTVATTTSASNTTFYIGNNDADDSGIEGFVAEVILFSSALSATEYSNVENYLSNKWGL